MKISAKLLILTLALFIVTASVFFFLKAMTKPPTQMEDIDEFSLSINKDIEDVTDTLTQEELDSTYIWILTELKKWNENSYLNDVQYNKYVQEFFHNYVFSYSSVMKKTLSTGKWGNTEKRYILEQVANVQSEMLIGQNKAVIDANRDLKTEINSLTDICSDYDEACKLISTTKYVNIDDAKKRVNKAKTLANSVYIGHSDISTKVSSFPNDVGNSHYDLLKSYYSKLENWSYYTLYQTKDNFSTFNKIVDEYKRAGIYGNGHPKSTSDFVKQAKQYMQEAYDNKCSLTVNGNTGSYTTFTWLNSSGTYDYNIYTDHPDGYTVTDLPNWISIKEKNKDRLSISYNQNNQSYSRDSYFYVKAGNKSVRVNCKQNGPENNIRITSITQDHNVWKDGKKGMNIYIYFDAIGFQGKTLNINAYFYKSDGTPLKDNNKSYYTSDGYVAAGQTYIPSSNDISGSVTIFMPHDELHMSSGKYNLKFYVAILQNGKTWTSSSYYGFTFSK